MSDTPKKFDGLIKFSKDMIIPDSPLEMDAKMQHYYDIVLNSIIQSLGVPSAIYSGASTSYCPALEIKKFQEECEDQRRLEMRICSEMACVSAELPSDFQQGRSRLIRGFAELWIEFRDRLVDVAKKHRLSHSR